MRIDCCPCHDSATRSGPGLLEDFGLWDDESGSVLLEFAANAMLLFTIVFGIMEFSRAIYIDHFVANAAAEAARYASVRGSTFTASCSTPATVGCAATSSNITAFVQKSVTAGISTTSLSVTTSWSGKTPSGVTCRSATGANSPGCTVQVKVAYAFSFVMPFVLKNSLTLSSTAASAIYQ